MKRSACWCHHVLELVPRFTFCKKTFQMCSAMAPKDLGSHEHTGTGGHGMSGRLPLGRFLQYPSDAQTALSPPCMQANI